MSPYLWRVMRSLCQAMLGFALLDAAPFNTVPVPDAELSDMRGGFALPDGLNLSLGIDLQTSVDGALVLHTQYSTDGSSAGLHVSTAPVISSGIGSVTVSLPAEAAAPNIQVNGQASGTTVTATPQVSGTNLVINTGGASSPAVVAGSELPLTQNGQAIQTPSGSFSLSGDNRDSVVTYNGPQLEVQHLIGQITGVVVANSGNNRAIDTVSTVTIDLQNVPIAQYLSNFAAQRAAIDAARTR